MIFETRMQKRKHTDDLNITYFVIFYLVLAIISSSLSVGDIKNAVSTRGFYKGLNIIHEALFAFALCKVAYLRKK